MGDLYYEDFQAGQTFTSRAETLTRERLIAFAKEYDPQPAHIGEEEAAHSQFGELVASGWQTASITMRLQYKSAFSRIAGGGMGANVELSWVRPVRPGDQLHVTVEVREMRPSRSRPDRGLVTFMTTTFNQSDQPVQTMLGTVMVPRRTQA